MMQRLIILFSIFAAFTAAQTYTIETVAGGASIDGHPANRSVVSRPEGLAFDSAGNLFIAELGNSRVRKIAAGTGIITTVAGNGTDIGFLKQGDNGPAVDAPLDSPFAVAIDQKENVYIAMRDLVRKVDAVTGIITTVAGDGKERFSGDGGPAASASLWNPMGLAVDSAGNLYICDQSNSRIRKVDMNTGTITTIVGSGAFASSGDGGPALSAGLSPYAIALDLQDNLYIVDAFSNTIRKVTAATGIISTVAGNGTNGFSGDGGPALAASFSFASPPVGGLAVTKGGIAVNGAGDIYVVDEQNQRVRKIAKATGIVTTVVGDGKFGFRGDGGPAVSAEFDATSVAVDSADNLYISDYSNNRIRMVAAGTGIITTFAGTGSTTYAGDGGPARDAILSASDLARDSSGNLFIADVLNFRIRKVTASDGLITTIAGNGTMGSSGDDGPATKATFGIAGNYSSGPLGVAADSSGNLYISDGNRVRKITAATGVITTIAGNGTAGFSGDGGPASGAMINHPSRITFDHAGNVYIADSNNDRIRKISVDTGIITTVAGGRYGFSGDGGPAVAAGLTDPSSVAVDSKGNIYIDDFNRIRKVDAITGIITTVAGDGNSSFKGDGGPAVNSSLFLPDSVAVDGAGNLYIADTGNLRIRKVAVDTGVITTIAGGGIGRFEEGSDASQASIYPESMVIDSDGNIYFVDGPDRILKLIPVPAGGGPTKPQTISFSPLPDLALHESPFAVSATATSGLAVIFSSGTAAVCKVSGATVTLLAAGTCAITASQPGNTIYKAAVPITRSFNVVASGSRSQTISFGILQDRALGGAPFQISVSADSALPVNVSTNSPSVCTVGTIASGATTTALVSLLTGGTCSITATQSGDATFAAAPAVTRTFAITTASAGPHWPSWGIEPGQITTIAGIAGLGQQGSFSGDGGGSALAGVYAPIGITVDQSGNVFIADTYNLRIRRIDGATSIVSTIAGNGSQGFSGDGGPATSAQLNLPSAVAVDSTGNIFISDSGNNRIRKIAAGTGILTTIAGVDGSGYSGSVGPAASAQLNHPSGIVVDGAGNLLIADTGNNVVRRIDSNGNISTIAGTGARGNSGDDGAATDATFSSPSAIVLDSAGNLFIADSGNSRVRMLNTATGIVTAFAGTGGGGSTGDGGNALSAEINVPNGLAADGTTRVYISDTFDRVRMVDRATGTISSIAGNGSSGPFGDGGPATAGHLYSPFGLALDGNGNLYIADAGNSRIRFVMISAAPAKSSQTISFAAPVSQQLNSGQLSLGASSSSGMVVTYTSTTPLVCTVSGNITVFVDAGTCTITASQPGSDSYAAAEAVKQSFAIVAGPGAPSVSVGGVTPLGSTSNNIAPGSWATIYGTDLASGTATWQSDYPTTLADVSVTVNGKPAYLWYVSPTQINLEFPDDTTTGLVTVIVKNSKGKFISSAVLTPVGPSFNFFDQKYLAAVILTPNGSGSYQNGAYDLAGPVGTFAFQTRPVAPGETILLFGTGFGATDPVVTAGSSFTGAAPTVDSVEFTIGGITVAPLYSVATAPGVYQFAITVPSLPSGDQNVVATTGSAKTPVGSLTIR